MNWIIKTLVGAVVAGVGWKFGSDAYETVKKKVKEYQEDRGEDDESEEDGAGATTTDSVDVTPDSRSEQ